MNKRTVKGLELSCVVRCPDHPRYMARRAPNLKCTACNTIWMILSTMATSKRAVRSYGVKVLR